jgi:hypothetical protein
MDTHHSAADRIRPILRAMERSIDSARRNRVHGQGEARQPSVPPPMLPQPAISGLTTDGPRLKARPKRLAC